MKCTVEQHEQLKANPSTWSSLPLVGRQSAYDDQDPTAELELRNCTACRSTLAVFVGGKR